MEIYINSTSAISPIDSFYSDSVEWGIPEPVENGLHCVEPVYKEVIESKNLRRMSKVVRMGLATALKALADAQIVHPEAIITGTGLGCLLDTEKFLAQMVENNEALMNPTAFIQSTHNTVAGQIALHLGCRSYNLTFSQKNASFETALMESCLLLADGEANNVLLGGIDEITEAAQELIQKSGCGKAENNPNGYIVGEGAAFFTLSSKKQEISLAKLVDLKLSYQIDNEQDLQNGLSDFLGKNKLKATDIDLILLGENNDTNDKNWYSKVCASLGNKMYLAYKKYCGEHDCASSFALWLAVKQISKKQAGHVLIYNTEKGYSHSFILVSAC